MVTVIQSPCPVPDGGYKIFLAGSIDNGAAENWQDRLSRLLPNDAIVLNPRRPDWDSSWQQDISDPVFRHQVEWELDAMEKADRILVYFAPGSQAPVTLLEFGLHARSGKLIVCCPTGFWRKGNIDIVCRRYDVPQVDTLEDLAAAALCAR